MMLKIWPWCKIRELDERNTALILQNLKNAATIRSQSARIAMLSRRLDRVSDECARLNEKYLTVQRERNGLLNIMALPPHELKRKRVQIRRYLRTVYEPVEQWREIVEDDDDDPSRH